MKVLAAVLTACFALCMYLFAAHVMSAPQAPEPAPS